MARSVRAALRGRSIETTTGARVERALEMAMRPRVARLPDDHHPAWLHPGRSVLILLHDVETIEEPALPLATLHESVDEALRVSTDEVEASFGAELAMARDALPAPGDDALVEALVGLSRGSALALLAERLDHLRHLHLRPDLRSGWGPAHAEVERAWLPFAHRIDERLATRFAHWHRTFSRRLARAARDA